MQMSHLLSPAVFGVLALTATASAQGFNVDFNGFSPITPTAAYAAAGTAGTWNSVLPAETNVPLVDKSGAATGVTCTVSPHLHLSITDDNPNMTGDDAALMESAIYGGLPNFFYPITFTGLANGVYDVYTYSLSPWMKLNYLADIDVTQSTDGVQTVGGALFFGHTLGGSYAKHTATVTGGVLAVQVRIHTTLGFANGIQIEPLGGGPVGTPYCYGDGTGSVPCPCSNTGTAGRGCANSTASGGGLLEAWGSASVGAANLVLAGSGLQPGQPGLYFQGDNAINGGNGIQNGDGLRCASGSIRRLQVRAADASGHSATNANIAVQGAVGAGDTKRYQLWYRNPSGSPCGTTFNLTNGLEIVWGP